MSILKSFCTLGFFLALLQPTNIFAAGSRGTPDPVRVGLNEFEQGLGRTIGQTRFITAVREIPRARAMAASRGGDAALESAPSELGGGTAQRDVVDSDVYAHGPKGSNLLLLLNGYRGLMIMDFSKGKDKPQLVGRAPATGNHPSDMYVDWKSKKAIVIEEWSRQEAGVEGASIVVYDLSELKNPKMVQRQDIEGSVSDSRLVGDVLYVVGQTRIRDPYMMAQQAKSYAKSFKINKDAIEMVSQLTLAQHVDYAENMGIQEVAVGKGQYRYYITAITHQEQPWRWWARGETGSTVEVLDITSPSGEILPIMMAKVSGRIEKRSWVSIHGGELIVTSNYIPGGNRDRSKLRVAVETFDMPTASSTIIEANEAKLRELSIERALAGKDNGDAEKAEQLVSSGPFQLRKVFVKTGDTLTKMVSDYRPLDFGDTENQNAAIQDVRLVVDSNGAASLRVAWVPQNQIDPYDIVNIRPGARPEYQSRLRFDGWLVRTIPLEYKGRKFVLGLGYVIPAVDNPQNRRQAQAKILEVVTGSNGKLKSEEIATVTLANVGWSDMGGQDKFVQLKFDPTSGRGALLFAAHNWFRKEPLEGGQVVEFDLSADKVESVLTEGSFIKGEQGWLRRVFNYDDAMMTFSDHELGVFGEDRSATEGGKFVNAITRVELARNIVAYVDLPAVRRGLQVISLGEYGSESIEIRSVALDAPDAEKPNTQVIYSAPGRFKDIWVDPSSGEAVVLTSSLKGDWVDDKYEQTLETTVLAFRLNEKGEIIFPPIQLAQSKTQLSSQSGRPRRFSERQELGTHSIHGLVQVANGWAFADDFNALWLATKNSAAVALERVELIIPKELENLPYELSRINGGLYVQFRRPVEASSSPRGWNFHETLIAPVETVSATKWKVDLAKVANIPGQAEGFVYGKGGRITGVLTSETRVTDMAKALTEPVLNVVTVQGQKFALTSMMSAGDGVKLANMGFNRWAFVEQQEAPQSRYGYRGSMPWPGGSRLQPKYNFVFVDVDAEKGTIHRTLRGLDGQLAGYQADIVTVAKGPSNDEMRVVVSAGYNVQVLDVNAANFTVTPLPITAMNTHVEPINSSDRRTQVEPLVQTVWALPAWGLSGTNVVSLQNDQIRVAAGDYGICEAALVFKK